MDNYCIYPLDLYHPYLVCYKRELQCLSIGGENLVCHRRVIRERVLEGMGWDDLYKYFSFINRREKCKKYFKTL